MHVVSKVHAAGVIHGALISADNGLVADSLRHFVVKADSFGGPKVLLVDFASASLHACGGASPALCCSGRGEWCAELECMEETFGQVLDWDPTPILYSPW